MRYKIIISVLSIILFGIIDVNAEETKNKQASDTVSSVQDNVKKDKSSKNDSSDIEVPESSVKEIVDVKKDSSETKAPDSTKKIVDIKKDSSETKKSDSAKIIVDVKKDTSETVTPDSTEKQIVDSKADSTENDTMEIIEEEGELFLGEDDLLITDDKEENILSTVEDIAQDSTVSDTAKALQSKDSTERVVTDEGDKGPADKISESKDSEVIIGSEEEIQKAMIENLKSIDFTRNLKEYRSPKKAMFLSLLLPGLGQAYAKKYWKTAMFGSIETLLIALSIKFRVDGKGKRKESRDYADQFFSMKTFCDFYKKLLEVDEKDTTRSIDDTLIFGEDVDYFKNKFGDEPPNHDSKSRDDYDRYAQDGAFVQGWEDCEPGFDDNGFIFTDTLNNYFYAYYDTSTYLINRYNKNSSSIKSGILGYSKYQEKYNDIIDKSHDLYDISKTMIMLLVVNHLVSAVDALFSTRAYNRALLKQKSVWQHISLEQRLAFSKTGVNSWIGVKVRF